MIKQDNLHTGEEARARLMIGVTKASEAVAVTLGTAGSNSLIQAIERPGHFATNDGATILGSTKFADPLEEMGRSVLFEAVSRANRSSGDGSSTTCVLTKAILEEGLKYVRRRRKWWSFIRNNAHIGEQNPMEIKRSLEACIPTIEDAIRAQKKDITLDTVAQVATISAEDEGIGKTIQEIYQKIGPEGIIQWDISKTAEDTYSIGTGLTINGATYAAPYMADEGSTEVRMKNPHILLARKKITTALDFETLFPVLYAKDIKELVIFCEEIDAQVIGDLFKTQKIRGFRTVVIKMPILWRDEWWEDLSKVTGGTLIDIASGIKLSDAKEEHLGTLENITITKEDTFLDGIKDVSKHVLALKVDGSDRALLRASRLNTKTARYFVGAHSDSALAYRRLKVEDAINAASCALANGVVAGGGVALNAVAKTLTEDTVGEAILKEALQAPIRQIITNAGVVPDPILKKVDAEWGFDSRTGEIVPMLVKGIIDPTDVVVNAIKNAIGVAASVLTVETVVTLPKDDSPAPMR